MKNPWGLVVSTLILILFFRLAAAATATVSQRTPFNLSDGRQEQEASTRAELLQGLSPRRRFKLPTALSFSSFKATFKRKYHSITEELVRCKLFLSRSFRAFTSALAYKIGRSSFYKAINSRADRTKVELDASRNNRLEALPMQVRDECSLTGSALAIDATYSRVRSGMNSGRASDEKECLGADVDEWSAGSCTTERWPIENDPDYRRIYLREMVEGKERYYDHLPVKGNHKMLGRTPELDSVENLWNNNWFGSDRRRTPKKKPSDDVVWADHRWSGCMQRVQDQGDCGSCYAFTTIAFLEWAYCKETGKRVKFSEQYLVDCGNGKPELYGCEGGSLVHAGEFTLNFGLEYAHRLSYSGQENSCPKDDRTALIKPAGSLQINLTHVAIVSSKLFEEYLQFAPILTTLSTFDDFDEFGGGVYDGRKCNGEPAGHSVLLVGHGREDGEEYWLLRNSFGTSWGESGYMKLNKNSNCISPEFGFILGSRDGRNVRLWPRQTGEISHRL